MYIYPKLKFQENRVRIDGEIAENHAILVNLTASIVVTLYTRIQYAKICVPKITTVLLTVGNYCYQLLLNYVTLYYVIK